MPAPEYTAFGISATTATRVAKLKQRYICVEQHYRTLARHIIEFLSYPRNVPVVLD
jgi:hypothetical protein